MLFPITGRVEIRVQNCYLLDQEKRVIDFFFKFIKDPAKESSCEYYALITTNQWIVSSLYVDIPVARDVVCR